MVHLLLFELTYFSLIFQCFQPSEVLQRRGPNEAEMVRLVAAHIAST